MSFNNATTVNAADIVGTIGENVTIEGAQFRTAAPPNERWEMDSTTSNQLRAYSGNPNEVAPGGVTVSEDGAGNLTIKPPQLKSPVIGSVAAAPGEVQVNWVDYGGTEVVLRSQYGGRANNPDTNADLFTWDANGKLMGPGLIDSVPYGGTTDASGFLIVTHNMGWLPVGGWAFTINPSASFAQPWGIDSFTSTTCRLRFANVASTGAAASTAVSGRLFLVHP